MAYIYKKKNYYIYKRRIPYTNKFYTFNTTFTNYKKASKFVIIFNKLSRDIFEYIKKQGKILSLDLNEVLSVLDDYKERALKETKEYEETRHEHIGQLFKIKKKDPLMGTITLSGGQPEVIEMALQSFENLAVGNYNLTKKHLKKHGKDIVSRATPELKNLYQKIRTKENEKDLLDFLGMILKAEAEILKEDYSRAKNRFSIDTENRPLNNYNNYQEEQLSYLEEQQQKYMLIEDISKKFLFNECGYTEEELSNSKKNASKVKKVVEIFMDIIKDTKREQTSQSITVEILRECFNIIPKIPMKPANQNGSYSFYYAYKKNKNATKDDLRGEKTIIDDLNSFFRFVKYLAKKKFINTDKFLDLETHLKNIKRDINIKITNSEIREKKKRTAFKDGMLQKIFSKEHKPYSIIFNELANCEDKDRDIILARFLVPIVLFFTGARPAEITFLKTTDCEIQNIKGEERIILYLEANELKDTKTRKSKRIVIVHDFLAKELNFINFIKNAMKEKREFLFNAVEDFETKISVGFNRNKDFLEGNISRIDDFNNLTYTLYSFRHTYKTHMLSQINIKETIIDKIQGHTDKKVSAGYFSITEELIDTINSFDKHSIIDWSDIKMITDNFKYL
ncbi:MAG: hypothetical protein RBT22_08400 [Aliarcobacter sp.]|nr:hypothetical protein [Aliarcobacter sp.]